jgi:hypothetical protein
MKCLAIKQWHRFKESHAQNIKVYWPDGHVTEGLDVHLEDMKKLFVHAPDTRIKEHPIKFGSGNYTAVTGVLKAHLPSQCLSVMENSYNLRARHLRCQWQQWGFGRTV